MAVTVDNLLAGPGTLYIGAFGATEPAFSAVNSTPAASAWTDLGGTKEGLKITNTQEFFELEVDQIVEVVGRRKIKNEVKLSTSLAEVTLDNLVYAWNGGTVTDGSGYSYYDPDVDTSATQPTYRAALFHGWAPGAAGTNRRMVIARKVLNVAETETEHKKDDQTVIPVEFACHYVSSSIKPFRIIDGVTP